jgi:hypothetical protein
VGEVGNWTISGTEGHCQASKQFESSSINNFTIGITQKGTFFGFQHLKWVLPRTRTNMMSIEISFDGSVALKTEALLVHQAFTFQVLPELINVPEEEVWKRFLSAKSMRVVGKFKPGRAEVDVKNSAEIVPLFRDCAQRYLSGIDLPF